MKFISYQKNWKLYKRGDCHARSKNASFSYGETLAVNNVSFTIKPGEIFGVLGANGGGKTTIFRMIMGLIQPDAGEIKYFDRIVSYEDVNEIGYLIEERSLLQK